MYTDPADESQLRPEHRTGRQEIDTIAVLQLLARQVSQPHEPLGAPRTPVKQINVCRLKEPRCHTGGVMPDTKYALAPLSMFRCPMP